MWGVKKIDWGAKVLTYRQIAKGQSLFLSNISQKGEMPAGHRVSVPFHHCPVASKLKGWSKPDWATPVKVRPKGATKGP